MKVVHVRAMPERKWLLGCRFVSELSDEELEKRGVKQLPKTLLEAITAFEHDDLGRRVMGEELYRSYIDLKKSEWWSYHNAISQWEIDEYLTKF